MYATQVGRYEDWDVDGFSRGRKGGESGKQGTEGKIKM